MRKLLAVLLLSAVCFAQSTDKSDILAQVTALLAEKLEDQRVEIETLKYQVIETQNQMTSLAERIALLESNQK